MHSTKGLLLPRVVNRDELMELVHELGGEWQQNEDLPQGFIGDQHTWLFIRGVDTQQSDVAMYSAAEIADAEHRCGKPIVAVLTVDHTRGTAGDALARRVIQMMVSRWRGCPSSG